MDKMDAADVFPQSTNALRAHTALRSSLRGRVGLGGPSLDLHKIKALEVLEK